MALYSLSVGFIFNQKPIYIQLIVLKSIKYCIFLIFDNHVMATKNMYNLIKYILNSYFNVCKHLAAKTNYLLISITISDLVKNMSSHSIIGLLNLPVQRVLQKCM